MSENKKNKITSRKCIVTNQVINVEKMLRFDFDKKNNIITLDINQEKKGRGAYFVPTQENWQKIMRHKGLNRAFRTPVAKKVYEDINHELEDKIWTKTQE